MKTLAREVINIMTQNLSKILYLMPLIAFITGYIYYYIILSPSDRITYTIIQMVFKDPIIFIIGFSGIVFGTVADKINGLKNEFIARRIEKIAILWLIMEVIFSILIVGLKPIELFNLLIEGKFLTIQPLMILAYSLTITMGRDFMVKVGVKNLLKAVILTVMVISPAYIFYMSIKEGQSMQNYVNGLTLFTIAFTLYILLNLKMLGKKVILRG